MQQNDKLYLEFFGASDIGLVRKENQDSFGKFPSESDDRNQPKGILFIVADGMGGHASGEVASHIAVHEFRNAVEASKSVIDGFATPTT